MSRIVAGLAHYKFIDPVDIDWLEQIEVENTRILSTDHSHMFTRRPKTDMNKNQVMDTHIATNLTAAGLNVNVKPFVALLSFQ